MNNFVGKFDSLDQRLESLKSSLERRLDTVDDQLQGEAAEGENVIEDNELEDSERLKNLEMSLSKKALELKGLHQKMKLESQDTQRQLLEMKARIQTAENQVASLMNKLAETMALADHTTQVHDEDVDLVLIISFMSLFSRVQL